MASPARSEGESAAADTIPVTTSASHTQELAAEPAVISKADDGSAASTATPALEPATAEQAAAIAAHALALPEPTPADEMTVEPEATDNSTAIAAQPMTEGAGNDTALSFRPSRAPEQLSAEPALPALPETAPLIEAETGAGVGQTDTVMTDVPDAAPPLSPVRNVDPAGHPQPELALESPMKAPQTPASRLPKKQKNQSKSLRLPIFTPTKAVKEGGRGMRMAKLYEYETSNSGRDQYITWRKSFLFPRAF